MTANFLLRLLWSRHWQSFDPKQLCLEVTFSWTNFGTCSMHEQWRCTFFPCSWLETFSVYSAIIAGALAEDLSFARGVKNLKKYGGLVDFFLYKDVRGVETSVFWERLRPSKWPIARRNLGQVTEIDLSCCCWANRSRPPGAFARQEITACSNVITHGTEKT